MMDLTTGRAAVGKRAMCKLHQVKVTHSGGTTNLKNHLRSHHHPKYRNLYGDDLGSCMEVQSQLKMDVFHKSSCTVEKFSSSLARAQYLMSKLYPITLNMKDSSTENRVAAKVAFFLLFSLLSFFVRPLVKQ